MEITRTAVQYCGVFRKCLSGSPQLRLKNIWTVHYSVNSADPNSNAAKPYSAIPVPRYTLPYWGTALHYKFGYYSVDNMNATLLRFYRELGPLVREKHLGEEVVHVFDLDDVRTVYSKEGKIPWIESLLITEKQYRRQRDVALGVGNTNGEQWYRLRSVAGRMMMKPHMTEQFLSLEQEVADDFLEELKRRRDPQTGLINETYLQLMKWSFETSGYNVFHRRFNTLSVDDPQSEAIRMITRNRRAFELSKDMKYSFLPWCSWVSTPKWRAYVRDQDEFYGNVAKYFDEAIQAVKSCLMDDETGAGELDRRFLFLRYMLQAENASLKEAHITSQSLFVDGFSTTVPTAACLLYCLATNPDKQELLFSEIKEKIGARGNSVTPNKLQQVPYLKACLKEAFRLYILGPNVSRVTTQDLVLSGYHVPKGTSLMLQNAIHLRDPKHFIQPDRYLPERWLRNPPQEIVQPPVHPFLLLPFSSGARMCLGRRFAEQELFLLTIKLLQNFRLEWKGERALGQKWQFLNVPDQPIKIAFHLRN